jgi:hypothetical protein
MYLRLGFSIAAHLEPDILLLDEVLAVGDADFQAKCLERVNELHRDGRTIVFISHDLDAVERLCARVVLLSRGKVVADGPALEVINTYREAGRTRTGAETDPSPDIHASREVRLTSVDCLDRHGDTTNVLQTGEPATFRLHYEVQAPVRDARFEIYAFTMIDGRNGPWFQLITSAEGAPGITLQPGTGTIEFSVDEVGLLPGICSVSARVAHRDHPPGRNIDWLGQCLTLRIEPGRRLRGTFYLPHRWRMLPGDAASASSAARGDAGSFGAAS